MNRTGPARYTGPDEDLAVEDPRLLQGAAETPEEEAKLMGVGAVGIGGGMLTLPALALGIAGVAQKTRARGLAIAGLSMSAVVERLVRVSLKR